MDVSTAKPRNWRENWRKDAQLFVTMGRGDKSPPKTMATLAVCQGACKLRIQQGCHTKRIGYEKRLANLNFLRLGSGARQTRNRLPFAHGTGPILDCIPQLLHVRLQHLVF